MAAGGGAGVLAVGAGGGAVSCAGAGSVFGASAAVGDVVATVVGTDCVVVDDDSSAWAAISLTAARPA